MKFMFNEVQCCVYSWVLCHRLR